VVAGGAAQGVGGRRAAGDQVGRGQGGVGGGQRGGEAPGDQRGRGVEAEPAGPPDPAAKVAAAAPGQPGDGEGVGDQHLGAAGRPPGRPRLLQEPDQGRLVHGQDRVKAVGRRLDQRVPGRGQRVPDPLGPLHPLVHRPDDLAVVDLVRRVVGTVGVAGHHRHPVHGRTLPDQPPGR
jgi:hypothetical protein